MAYVAYPNFLIVGAAKAGTTSLYHYLGQHPQVYMSPVKEPHYFCQLLPDSIQLRLAETVTSETEYRALFQGARDEVAIGEASPSYLWDEGAPERIHSKVPEAKIVILLRDPVTRAFSHYLMDVREGVQNEPFLAALHEDRLREPKGWGVSHLYIELGMYAEQVERYLDLFGRDQVLILLFEELTHDTMAVLARVFTFLDVDSQRTHSIESDRKYNSYAAPRNTITQRILGNGLVKRAARAIVPQSIRAFVRDTLLLKQAKKPELNSTARQFLEDTYRVNIGSLEHLLDMPLLGTSWKWR